MKHCDFKVITEREDHRGKVYQVECQDCGIKIWVRDPNTKYRCRNKKVSGSNPGLIEQAKNYIQSTAKHIANGMELRTQEEINAIYEICKGCEFFKEKKGGFSCGKCGCNLNTNSSHVNNKLARRSDSCPIGKWGKGTDNP